MSTKRTIIGELIITSYRNVMKYDDNWELKIGSLENFDRIHHHCTSVNEVL